MRQQTVCKIPASPYAIQNHIAGNGSIVMNGIGGGGGVAPATPTKHSMLDKLKLFNKDKADRSSKTQISKRTSSSSGFSSARSERSDSSLSLNNDQTAKTSGIPVSQPIPSSQQTKDTKKSDGSTASKTKSKLLLSTSSSSKGSGKDTLTKKSDKKEKSPARMSADMSESKIAVPKVQKSASNKNESKLKLISSSRKSLIEQTASKPSGTSQIPPPTASSMPCASSSAMGKSQTSLTMQQQQQQQQPQLVNQTTNVVMTNIPKPMAAIKGQTKLSNAHNQTNAQKSNEQYADIKCQKLVDISSQNNNNNNNNSNNNNNNNISTNQDEGGRMQIIAPILIENAVVVNQQQQHALANHLQMQQALNQQNISMSDSCYSKSTMNSSSSTTMTTGPITNSCDSSIIYRHPSVSSEAAGASDVMLMRPGTTILSPSNKLILANRARHSTDRYGNMHDHCSSNGSSMIKASSNGSIASSASSSMTAMSSSNSSGPNGITTTKFHTVPTKQIQNVNGVIYEEEKQMTCVPMRPLLRGYNSHLTLPTRGNRNQNVAYDYNDDMAQGYCSDGDALRKAPVRYSDIENGYMSEGGGGGGGGTTNTITNGNVLHHHKPMLLRARTQLPTTMEER